MSAKRQHPGDASTIAGTSDGRTTPDGAPTKAGAEAADAGPRYPAIGEYAVIGDCRTAALVCLDGGIDWLCLPHFSGPAVFAALLDRERGGCFLVQPTQRSTARRRYLPGTAVLETTFETESGTAVLTDAMTVLNERPEILDPESEILRRIEVTSGEVELQIWYEPRPDYGARSAEIRPCGGLGWSLQDRGSLLFLRSDVELALAPDSGGLIGRTRLRAGERRHLSLSLVQNELGIILPLGAGAEERLSDTIQWWENWSGHCSYRGRYRDQVVRSAITLKLLSYSLSGAVVAAATTSLPETIGGERNWDYRFCWLRDASLTLEAFLSLGYDDEAGAFLEWLLHATRLTWPKLQVLYDVYGEAEVPERQLGHLEGWRGSRPVRVGNGAHDQLQLDVYGQVVVAAANFVMRGGQLDMIERYRLKGLSRAVRRLWRRPDFGIWEVRGGPRHYTHSKVMCWAALDCLLYLDEQGVLDVPRRQLERERTELANMIEEQCLDPERGYRAAIGSDAPDASLLLMPRYRYCEANDPRMRRTFASIDRELTAAEGLVLRYPAGFDGLSGQEHPFGICSFWAIEMLARQGQVAEAERRMDLMLARANDVGLYAEEIAAETGEAIGNFPQAFTHVGLILAAEQIAAAREAPEPQREA